MQMLLNSKRVNGKNSDSVVPLLLTKCIINVSFPQGLLVNK